MNELSSLNEHFLALEFDKVLSNLSHYTNCTLSKTSCLNLEIYNTKAQIEYALNLVDEAKRIIDNTCLYAPIEEIEDCKKIFKNHNFSAEEIFELYKNLKISRNTKNFIQKTDSPFLGEITNNFYVDKNLEDEVNSIFEADLSIKDDASEKLKSLRLSYKDNKDNLKNALNSLLQNPAFCENLQDTIISSRDGRPVFQVKASSKNKVQGIVHDISSTGLTYFIEPAVIVTQSNKLRQIELEIQAEIDRILFCLSQKFSAIQKELEENQKIIIEIDVIFAKARYAIHLKAQKPQINTEKITDIQAMRHPLLIEVKDEIVENDFYLGKDFNCLLITGSNTGGKTVALKCAGLSVLMAKAGLFVPCLGANIYPYQEIFCDISKEQSLEQGFSTFSAHITNVAGILKNTTSNSLILLDELGSGTDPEEGAALARAILEYIRTKNASAIITTHLGELKNLKYENNYFENASVLFNTQTLKPLYKLTIGISGTSNAIDISSDLGLDEQVIKNAREYLKNNSSQTGALFSKIEQTKKYLDEAKKLKEEYEEKLKEFKQNKKKSLENFKKKFQIQLENARGEIKQTVDEIRKEKSLKVAMRSYSKINDAEAKVRESFQTEDEKLSEKYKKLDINSLKIGQSVLIKKLNQVVILNSLPDKKGNVEIRIGNIKSKVNIKDLAKTDKKLSNQLKKIQVSFDNSDNLLSRLDLRGMRVIEAIDYLDEKLDKASLRGLSQISVIHGYGTGALKAAVNEYLKTSPYVAKFRYGDENEGRDGIVIVDLL